ncbi:MAG: hypothetical protein ACI80I_002293 [Akkermansiaceae bacterium]
MQVIGALWKQGKDAYSASNDASQRFQEQSRSIVHASSSRMDQSCGFFRFNGEKHK